MNAFCFSPRAVTCFRIFILTIPLAAWSRAEQVIKPVSITSATAATDLFPAVRLIDGNMEDSRIENLATVDQVIGNFASGDTAWVTADHFPSYYTANPLPPTPVLTFDLGTVYRLSEFLHWGYNFNIIGGAEGNEAKTFELTFSTDNVFDASDPTMTITRTAPTGVNLAKSPIFGSPAARYVRVRIPANFAGAAGGGGDRVGLSEVRFVGGPTTTDTFSWGQSSATESARFRDTAMSPAGNLAISFVSNGVRYGELIGGAWNFQTVIAATGGQVHQDTSLAFDGLGRPAVSYREFDSTTLFHAVRNGGTWNITTVQGPGTNPGFDSSLAHSPLTGEPAISHYGAALRDLHFSVRSGGTWNTTVVDGATSMVGAASSLAFAPDGQPAISYLDYGNKKLKYAKYSGSAWTLTNVADTNIGDGGETTLRFSQGGKPGIAYYQLIPKEFNGNTFNEFQLKYAEFVNGAWVVQNVYGETNAGSSLSMEFKPGSEEPLIAFKMDFNNRVGFAERVNGVWTVVEAAGSAGAGDEIDLSVKQDGTPLIVYGPSQIQLATRQPLVNAIKVTAVSKLADYLQINFTSAPGVGRWKAAGRPDFVTAAIDRTGVSVVTEPAPGNYVMKIYLPSPPPKYFVALSSGW